MPCMGPSLEAANRMGDEFTAEVLALLNAKHHVGPGGYSAHEKAAWNAQVETMRRTLRAMIWDEACNSF
jgi:hypothetical protein